MSRPGVLAVVICLSRIIDKQEIIKPGEPTSTKCVTIGVARAIVAPSGSGSRNQVPFGLSAAAIFV